jgi:hypothetical protein
VLPSKFQFIWPIGFRGDFINGQSQTRTFQGGHVNFVQAKRFQRRTFLLIDKQETRIRFIWLSVSEEKNF